MTLNMYEWLNTVYRRTNHLPVFLFLFLSHLALAAVCEVCFTFLQPSRLPQSDSGTHAGQGDTERQNHSFTISHHSELKPCRFLEAEDLQRTLAARGQHALCTQRLQPPIKPLPDSLRGLQGALEAACLHSAAL